MIKYEIRLLTFKVVVVPIKVKGYFTIQYGVYAISPNFNSVEDESQKGNHITLKIPMPERKNIENEKCPKAGIKNVKDPNDDKYPRLVMKPTTINPIIAIRQV